MARRENRAPPVAGATSINVPDDSWIARALHGALARGAIRPALQPIVHLGDGAISAFEVLARWTDDAAGPIPPARFIPVAEAEGLLPALTAHLVRVACGAARSWPGAFRLGFNISAPHFGDDAVLRLFEDAVGATGFPLARTQVEITETAVIGDLRAARATADALRARGVRVVLDDFGTGHSSLTRLQALPFDSIKIDASFVRSMGEAQDSQTIVAAVIGLARSLGVPVVAEGVETEGQAETLRRLGCDFAQGWLFGRPVPPEEVPDLLRARGERPDDRGPRDPSAARRLAELEAVYAAAPVGLCFLDRALRIRNANRHYAAMLGTEPKALLGRTMGEIDPAAMAHSQADLESARRGEPIPARLWRVPAGGRIALLNAAPARDEGGELLGLSLVVTELPGIV